MDSYILMTGILVFIARIFDVSIGTIRTIVTVQGRMLTAFFLGIIEVVLWIVVVGTVINEIKESPVLIVFYALGFATGNVVGIIAERELAFGSVALKIITNRKADEITEAFRAMQMNVTRFQGEGAFGPVTQLYTVCHRRDLRVLIPTIRTIDADAFYVTEQIREVSREMKPITHYRFMDSTGMMKLQAFIHFLTRPAGLRVHKAAHVAEHSTLRPMSLQFTGWRSALKKK